MTPKSAIPHLAFRAQHDPFFLGHSLSRYAAAEGLTPESLAARLGVPAADLDALRLCRAPLPGEDVGEWVEAVRAKWPGLDAGALREVVGAGGVEWPEKATPRGTGP